MSARRGGDAHSQFQLDRVGVLELVEQEVGVAGVQRAAFPFVLAQQAAGEHEQVVELEAAVLAAGVDG